MDRDNLLLDNLYLHWTGAQSFLEHQFPAAAAQNLSGSLLQMSVDRKQQTTNSYFPPVNLPLSLIKEVHR